MAIDDKTKEKYLKKSQDIIDAALKYSGTSQNAGGRLLGWCAQQMTDKIHRGSFKFWEVLLLFDELGIKLELVQSQNGFNVDKYVKGHGQRVRMMVDRVIYDTHTSHAISNSFWEDGENEYNDGSASELYVTNDGKYFIARYSDFGNNGVIEPVDDETASEYIKVHGADIEKEPRKNRV